MATIHQGLSQDVAFGASVHVPASYFCRLNLTQCDLIIVIFDIRPSL